jgi:hypothetical protein
MKITTISTAATALNVATTITVATTIVLNLGISPAQAFSGFNFKTKYSQAPDVIAFDPTRDIRLDSVAIDSYLLSNFTFVTDAKILDNSRTDGPISSDHGDRTGDDSFLTEGPVRESPTRNNIVSSLRNLNLNSILDSEDDAEASLNLFFSKPTNHLFFFERGRNSDLKVQLIDAMGGLLGNSITIDRNQWKDAGYAIDTIEIGGPQGVGSYGLRHDGLIAGIQITSQKGFNGPDFKVVGGNIQAVPQPSLLLGLGCLVRGVIKSRRKPQ